jgi:hypothetical protein
MSLASIASRIGKTASLRTADYINVMVTVKDAKTAYGNVRFLVSPVMGSGELWADSSRVTFAE